MGVLSYFNSGLQCCPKCGEGDLEQTGTVELDGTLATSTAVCQNCSAEIIECYTIDSFELEGKVHRVESTPLIQLVDNFENEVIKLVDDDRICGHDQVYDLSFQLVENLSIKELQQILIDDSEFADLNHEKIVELNPQNIYEIIQMNLRDYLDEVLIYEIAKTFDFEVI